MNPFHCERFIVPNTTDNSSLLFIEPEKKIGLKVKLAANSCSRMSLFFFFFFFDGGVKMCPC